jgi:hypothetical protein
MPLLLPGERRRPLRRQLVSPMSCPVFCTGSPEKTNGRPSLADRRVQTKQGSSNADIRGYTDLPERRWCRRYRSRPSRGMPERWGRDRNGPANVAPAPLYRIIRVLPIRRRDNWSIPSSPSPAPFRRSRKFRCFPWMTDHVFRAAPSSGGGLKASHPERSRSLHPLRSMRRHHRHARSGVDTGSRSRRALAASGVRSGAVSRSDPIFEGSPARMYGGVRKSRREG